MRYMTTQELMDLYGVAWFKMDELLGNQLVNSNGSNPSTSFNGTIQVIQGYSGNAKRFTGSQYVYLNNFQPPLGEKSYRFKIRNLNSVQQNIFGNNGEGISTAGRKYGENVFLLSDGRIKWSNFQNKTANGGTSIYPVFTLTSTISLGSDWHDVLLTWDGTLNENGVKMYIDDMYKPHATTKAKYYEEKPATHTFTIGINPESTTSNAYNLRSDLDEFEIYNKAIQIVPPPLNKILLSSNSKTTYSLTPPIYSTETAVPQMTSNTAPSGRVFASSVYSTSYDAWKGFDRLSNAYNSAIGSGGIGYLGYEFVNSIRIGKYAINKGVASQTYLPKNWTFEGSNNGTDWTILDTQVNQAFTDTDNEYITANTFIGSYRMYRLNWTVNNGANYTGIGELKIYELITPNLLTMLPNQSEQTFINYGMESPININQLSGVKLIESNSITHESGKTFTHTIDLSKRRVNKIILS